MTPNPAVKKVFDQFDAVMDTLEKTMDSIFGADDPKPTEPMFHCQWKSGGNFFIQGKSISDAWNRAGFSRDQIKELASYKELK